MFEGRLPAALQERAPRIVELPNGMQVWEFDGEHYTQVGMNAVAGRRPETVKVEPFRFDQMRRGLRGIAGRARGMGIHRAWAGPHIPSVHNRVFSHAVFRSS